jgi:hypothetical protein
VTGSFSRRAQLLEVSWLVFCTEVFFFFANQIMYTNIKSCLYNFACDTTNTRPPCPTDHPGEQRARAPSQGYVSSRQDSIAVVDNLSKGRKTSIKALVLRGRRFCNRLLICSSKKRVF